MNNQQDMQNLNTVMASAQGVSVGNQLREARERLGLSVNDVANRIKFAPRQIEWLEADDFVRLPEAAFVRGFVRSYARLVEMDSTRLLSGLPASHVQPSAQPEVKSVDVPMPTALSARRHNIVWLAAALLVALSLAIFERMDDRTPGTVESADKMRVQPLELPTVGAGGEAAPSAEQAQPSATVLSPAEPQQQTTAAAPVSEPSVQPAVRTAPAIAPVLVPKPQPEPKVVAPIPAPAPAAAPAPMTVPAVEPLSQKPEPTKPAASTAITLPWQFIQGQTARTEPPMPEATVASKPSPEPQVKPPVVVAVVAHALRFEFDEDAWVEVKDSTGKVLVSKMHMAGSLVRVASRLPLDITIGNAKAVRLFDNGKSVNLERYTTAEVAHIKLK